MLKTKEAAKYLGFSEVYLRNMRQGQHPYPGPEFTRQKFKGGHACVYTKEALDKWFEEHKIVLAERKKVRYKRQSLSGQNVIYEDEWDAV